MKHPLTKAIKRLPKKLKADDTVDFFIVAIAKPIQIVGGGKIHGFGAQIVCESGSALQPFAGWSDSESSSHMRGALAATLTSLEWMQANCSKGTIKQINSCDEYIYLWLPEKIREWIDSSSPGYDLTRRNLDILTKIEPHLRRMQNLKFKRMEPEGNIYSDALQLARDAAQYKLHLLNESGAIECDDVPNVSFVDDSNWLYERALSKNP